MLGALSPGKTLLGIPLYSMLIISGILLAIILCTREEKRRGLPRDTMIDLALWVVPFGIVGARLYYVAFEWERFAQDPIRILYIWEGGIAIYGALIAGLAACLIFARRRKLSLPVLADIVLPTVALAQAIGRWGNYFNMEAYGEPILNAAWQFFPAGVLIPGADGYTWHLATFFYESLWDLGVFLILWLTRRKVRRPGDTALWYILLYGPGRAFIEGLRTDSLYTGGGIRVSQWLSLFACAAAVVVFVIRVEKNRERRFRLPHPTALPCLVAIPLMIFNLQSPSSPGSTVIPSLILLALLAVMMAVGHGRTLRMLLPMGLILVQAAGVLRQQQLDPLFYRTLQIACWGLMFPACAFVMYPMTERKV